VALGPDALARAMLLDKPIFLSVGYAARHSSDEPRQLTCHHGWV